MKKIIGWLHLWLGIGSGLVVLTVALTGSILVFERELEPRLSPGFSYVEVPANGAKAVSMDILTQTVLNSYKDYNLRQIVIEQEADRSVIFSIQKGKHDMLAVAVNQYTGRIIKAVDEESRFFNVVLRLHRYLCMGTTGKVITGISCSIFLIMVITGIVLWWPKRNARKQRMRVKWDASWKRLNWDLHAVLGFYVHIVIFLIALTGLTWSYQWVNDLIFYTFDGKPMKKMTPPKTEAVSTAGTGYMSRIMHSTDSILAYNGPIRIRFAEKKDQAITVLKRNTGAAIDNIASTLYFEAGTGRLVQVRLYENESRGMKVRRLVYPIHTGSLLGWPTKLLALIAALVSASLPVTGLCIWLNRKKKKKPAAKRNKTPQPLSVPVAKDSVSFPAGIS
jgi:uncharacterized iron-regulated membrane protein